MIAHGQKQQRARQQLSCTSCRAGKLKCDRQQPCDQCRKRAREDSCHYLPAPPKKKQSRNTKERIAQLEGLVVQLMNRDRTQGISSVTPPISDDGGSHKSRAQIDSTHLQSLKSTKESPQSDDGADLAAHNLTYLKVSGDGESLFRGSSHWEAILDSIAQLRDDFDGDNNNDEDVEDVEKVEQRKNFSKTVIIGAPPPVSRSTLINSLPPKNISDRFLWYWFNSVDPGLPIIHQPTFLSLYDTLWIEPSKIPTMWLALLYLILALGAKIAMFSNVKERGEVPDHLLDPDKYQQLGASALALADYTKPQRYVIEALMTLMSCEYMNRGNGHTIWLMNSFIIRLALRMGYHRDADNFPKLSVFDGEMRRRVWTILFTFDVLHSYQEGLPSMVQQIHSDTKPASNLLDTDFGPTTKVLPQPRPLMEISPMSYRVVKNRLSKVFALACDMSHMPQTPQYEDIMKVHDEIDKIYSETPEGLRFSSMSQAILDPPNMIFNRFKLELLFHKTRCVLHRRSMFQTEVASPQEHSRKLCVEAAMNILRQHETIFLAAQDGGQLRSSRYFLASLNSADFLLAAMVLCLELHLISLAPTPELAGPNKSRDEEMRSLLEGTYNIFKNSTDEFSDAAKAAKAMEAILRKAQRPSKAPHMKQAPVNAQNFTFEPTSINRSGVQPLYNSFENSQSENSTLFEPISGMLEDNTDIGVMDWAAWDRLVLQYNDPNNVPLQFHDPDMWPHDLRECDFPEFSEGYEFNFSNLDQGSERPCWSWCYADISCQLHNKNPTKSSVPHAIIT
ncbi:hypothetical protein, variant [Verruconis gallopava]|uniref:Zn(2)-C6 fungal-type domain-containing protein n=1 Tax=Verruconis gallopava TaxID=253628 RepID=A0A0D2AY48_9PEZI|nr:hypothetical protein, variant [Verruconis gallopava]KIW04054.1 hypothetical protein, variant [Verruconis gallopava]